MSKLFVSLVSSLEHEDLILLLARKFMGFSAIDVPKMEIKRES